MGQYKDRKWTTDKVGKVINLSSCPVCQVCGKRPDCFACINGRCTALRETVKTNSCPFYKSVERNKTELEASFNRLMSTGRIDLITKYMGTLAELGVFDDKLEDEKEWSKHFDDFRERDFRAQMENTISVERDDLLEDSILDGEEIRSDDRCPGHTTNGTPGNILSGTCYTNGSLRAARRKTAVVDGGNDE